MDFMLKSFLEVLALCVVAVPYIVIGVVRYVNMTNCTSFREAKEELKLADLIFLPVIPLFLFLALIMVWLVLATKGCSNERKRS